MALAIHDIFLLISGAILAANVLGSIPGVGNILRRIITVLAYFGALIGLIDIILFFTKTL
jgi:tellurite resistance protein TehA-like permease